MMRGWMRMMMVAAALTAPAFARGEEPGCVDEPNPEAVDRFGPGWLSRSGFGNGVEIGYRAEIDGRPLNSDQVRETHRVSNGGLERLFADTKRGIYAGYRLEIAPAGPEGTALRVTIKRLPADFEPSLSFCKSCSAWTPMSSKLARYPEPFVVADGTEFLVDVLVNPTTGGKVVDRIKVVRGRANALLSRPGLRVQARFDWQREGGSKTLAARFCVRQASSGRVVAAANLSVEPDADGSGSAVTEPEIKLPRLIQTQRLRISVSLAPGGREGVYEVEVKDAFGIVHAEEVRFPLES